jgi:type III secretion protein N (ATPase)
MRGVIDGHLILSREIAAQNRYPAIDVLGSLSRVMPQVVKRDFMASSSRLRKLLAKHKEVDMLLQIGEYQPGTNAVADEAIEKIDALKAFLSQPTDTYADPAETEAAMHALASGDATWSDPDECPQTADCRAVARCVAAATFRTGATRAAGAAYRRSSAAA